MRKKFYKLSLIISALFLSLFTFVQTGNAKWVFYKGCTVGTKVTEPVCYNSTTQKYYTTIEKALEKAESGQTVYVIPTGYSSTTDKSVHISRDCVVKSGVTLTLPFEGETWDGRQTSEIDFDDSNGLVDSSLANVAKYFSSEVTVDSDVTLTNYGTINIGGVLGREYYNGEQGSTSGKYSQITLDHGASIVNTRDPENTSKTGTMKVYGYIKEKQLNNSSLVKCEYGNIYAPYVIYDYRGGSNTIGTYQNGGIAPFNVYAMPNIQSKFSIKGTATLYGLCDLYTDKLSAGLITINARHNTTDAIIVSNANGLVNLESSDSVLTTKYTPKTLGLTTRDDCISEMTITGGASFGVLKLSIEFLGTQEVETSDVFFPIPYKYRNITLSDGTYNFGYKTKFLTGTTLNVESDATINFTADTIFYQSFEDTAYAGQKYPSNLSGATIENKGTINVNSNLGAKVLPQSSSSVLSVNSSQSEVSSKEGYTARSGLSFPFTETSDNRNILKTNVFNNLSTTNDCQLEVGNYSASVNNGSYYYGVVNGTVSDIVGENTVSVNSKDNKYTAVFSNSKVIADSVEWSINDNSLATLKYNGNKTDVLLDFGNTQGTVLLTAQLKKNGAVLGNPFTKEITITKPAVLVDSITLGGVPSTFKSVGDYFTINSTVLPADASNVSLGYTSSDTNVATVSNTGLVTAVGEGNCTIRVSAQDGSGKYAELSFTISGRRIEKLELSPTSVSILQGKSTTVSITNYINAGSVTCKTDNSDISASIGSNGVITITANKYHKWYEFKSNNHTVTLTSNNGINGVSVSQTISVTVTG